MDRSTTLLAFIGGLIAALLAVLIVVLLTGGDDDGGAGGTEATTSTSSTTTTTQATTTSSSSTSSTTSTSTTTTSTTTTTTNPCAAFTSVLVPAGATDVSTAIGDIDGDGLDDTVHVYQAGGDWYVHAVLATGFGARVAFMPDNGTPGMEDVVNIGVAEEVALVNTGFGLPGPLYSVWFLADCEIREATHDGGEIDLWVGGGPTHSEAFACTSSGITFIEAYESGSNWTVEETPWDWVPGLGDFQTQPSSSYTTDEASAKAAAGDIDC